MPKVTAEARMRELEALLEYHSRLYYELDTPEIEDAEYTPEQLVGKKIIVVANLEPARLTGVTSEGMLLAADNPDGSANVIFVADDIAPGSKVR